MVEEHTRRTVQLGYNNTLGTIDHKGTVVCHERNFTHVDFLFFNILDRLVSAILVIDNQAHFDAQRHSVSYATELTFLNVKCWRTQAVTNIF